MYQPKRSEPVFKVSALSVSEFRITNEHDGLSFVARLEGDELLAEDAPVTIDPAGSAAAAGWTSRTMAHLRWNLATGVYTATTRTVTDNPGGGLFLGFVDARGVGSSDRIHSWVRYRAETNAPWDFPHGDECLLGGGGTSEGYFGLAFGADRQTLEVYVQGIGCSFAATSTDGNTFTAADADCPLDPTMSIAFIGILTWRVETFSLDMSAKRVSLLARATRERGDGMLVDLCWKLDSDLAGELPR